MTKILLRTSLYPPRARARYSIFKGMRERRRKGGKEECQRDPVIARQFRGSMKGGRSLLVDCCGICPFCPLISGPLVLCCSLFSSLPPFLSRALLSLTFTISSSIDLPGSLGESSFFFYFDSSLVFLFSSNRLRSKSSRKNSGYDRIKW